jgi:predicted RNase H-like HicB family nuclease
VKTYDLYLDSGPMKKKTYVHVPQLMGCIARGDTSDAAVENSPGAIRTFLAFCARFGEALDPSSDVRVRVAEHITTNQWPGNGGGFLPTDAKPLMPREGDALMARLAAIHAGLRHITKELTPKQLDAIAPKGRPIRRILQHICVEGAYLRAIPGSSRLMNHVDKGLLDPHDGLDQLFDLEQRRLRAMSKHERSEVIMRGQTPWSARAAVRRMLEHGWEHYLEISERLNATP